MPVLVERVKYCLLSHSSAPPEPGSPRQSPPSPHRSSVAAAAFPSEPPPDENCAHQLANYLAHDPPARLTDAAGSRHRRRPPQGGGQAPLTFDPRRDGSVTVSSPSFPAR